MSGRPVVVSLLPAGTEIVYALGAQDQLAGVTYECDHPPEAAALPHLSDTIVPPGLTPAEVDEVIRSAVAEGRELHELHTDLISAIDPDVIISQDLCRVCALPAGNVEAALERLGCSAEVVSLDPHTLGEVLAGVIRVGQALGAADVADTVVAELEGRLAALAESLAGVARPRTLVLEWVDPPFSAGHWLPEMIERAGGTPVLGFDGARSEAVTWEAVAEADPQVIIVAPCGFGVDDAAEQARSVLARPEVATTTAGATGRAWAVDANSYLVRPGPRLVDGVELLAHILHPEIMGPPSPEAAVGV